MAGVGESSTPWLIALSQASSPHKYFISVLVRRQAGVLLPFEVDLSLGMRRYLVLLTGEKETVPTFRRDLGRYALQFHNASSVDSVTHRAENRSIQESSTDEICKSLLGSSPGIGQVEHGSRPGRPVGSSGGIPSTVEASRAPPGSESGVVRGSHGVTANHPELSNRILEKKVGNEGVVDLGSHHVTPAEKGVVELGSHEMLRRGTSAQE